MIRSLAAVVCVAFAVGTQASDHFEKVVRPLLVTHCQSCHNAQKAKGGLDLSTKAGFAKGGDSGPVVKDGNGPLLDAVQYDGDLKMPPKGKLKPAEIQAIETWVKAGAIWPDAGESAIGGKAVAKAIDPLWSLQPIAPYDPKGSIDKFITRSIIVAGIGQAPLASHRIWLRRVTFDLIGLPPTPEELAAFEADSSPQSCEKVVDRLLASPHYGERWARHWLDVARYADTNGMDENTGFQNAWKYRDFVVRSFNDDKPYDRFVREQIAGDLLPHATDAERRDGLTATGFLVIGPKLLAEPDKQKMVMDIVDEQLDTTAKAFLGLTVGCARCHDHKFDPLPTKDYYALAGLFASTKTMQSLATVAKANERPLAGDHDIVKAEAHRKVVEAADKLAQKVRNANSGRGYIAAAGGVAHHAVAQKLNSNFQSLKRAEPPVPMALAVAEEAKPADVKVHIRGNHLSLGEVAPRGSPSAIAFKMESVKGSGRLQFAEWVASPDNPLTARVIVNRIWQHHFGEGLVRTPDNFGRLGERPSNPDLLDWLAREFILDGWSVKALQRKIVLSNVYRRAGAVPSSRDPDNRLLAYFPRRRLDAEQIRDAMLAISGKLDRTVGGSLFQSGNFEYAREANYDSNRRTIYLPLIRNNIYDFLQTFDFPEPNVTNGRRAVTTVAPQALFLMNNAFVGTQAKAIAVAAIADEPDFAKRVDRIVRQIYLRPANDGDRARAKALIDLAMTLDKSAKTERLANAWAAWVKVLLASNEFLTLE